MHWELSERCEAWQLPLIQEMAQQLGLRKVTTHGCCVGLRTHDKKQLLCKGWTIASSSDVIIRHMNLRCQKNHKHGECRGKNANLSSKYTPVFARKVVDCFAEGEVWSRVIQDAQSEGQGQQQTARVKTEPSKHDLQTAAPATSANDNTTASAESSDATAPKETQEEGRRPTAKHSHAVCFSSCMCQSESALANDAEPPDPSGAVGGEGVESERERRERKRLNRKFSTSTVLPATAVFSTLLKLWKPEDPPRKLLSLLNTCSAPLAKSVGGPNPVGSLL